MMGVHRDYEYPVGKNIQDNIKEKASTLLPPLIYDLYNYFTYISF